MRVIDQYSGNTVDLPAVVEAGRYVMLSPAMLGSGAKILPGDILVGDGRETFSLDGRIDGRFLPAVHRDLTEEDVEIINRAVMTIARQIRQEPENDISPLIPAELSDLAELTELEKLLCDVSDAGHLNEIARRPKYSMRYETDVAPLSRVRRIAPKAEVYLANHSEDWHRRTLTGVLPKRILALFSEDEWAIYENRLFARLLDRLSEHLRSRLKTVESLNKKWQDAINLSNSQEMYFRLREDLCTLWGGAASGQQTRHMLDISNNAMSVIRRLLKRVDALRRSELYRLIPKNAQVSDLRLTNILIHDQHYRHLARLWQSYQDGREKTKKTPLEIFEHNQQLHRDYVVYIGFMLKRALDHIKAVDTKKTAPGDLEGATFRLGGIEGSIEFAKQSWTVSFSGLKLVLVPSFSAAGYEHSLKGERATRIQVCCYPGCPTDFENESDSPAEPLVVNPLEFLGLERLRFVLEEFLWKPLFRAYGQPVMKLPSSVRDWLVAHANAVPSGSNGVRFTTPLSSGQFDALEKWMPSASINQSTCTDLYRAIESLKALAECRQCGQPSLFLSHADGFYATCRNRDCRGIKWGITTDGKRRRTGHWLDLDGLHGFSHTGAWSINLAL
jgi:hypothetical protein